jgi:DnaK suppressor protein
MAFGLRDDRQFEAPPAKLRRVDTQRAQELLAAERARIEQALAVLTTDGPLEGSDRREPGDEDSEDLYQDEFDAGKTEELERDLAALERAEERLKTGKYGLSVESGEPIPDGRLEAKPTAELTIAEQERAERR